MSAMSSASISLYTARKASLSVEVDMVIALEVVLLALAEVVDAISGGKIVLSLYHKFLMVIGFDANPQRFWR